MIRPNIDMNGEDGTVSTGDYGKGDSAVGLHAVPFLPPSLLSRRAAVSQTLYVGPPLAAGESLDTMSKDYFRDLFLAGVTQKGANLVQNFKLISVKKSTEKTGQSPSHQHDRGVVAGLATPRDISAHSSLPMFVPSCPTSLGCFPAGAFVLRRGSAHPPFRAEQRPLTTSSTSSTSCSQELASKSTALAAVVSQPSARRAFRYVCVCMSLSLPWTAALASTIAQLHHHSTSAWNELTRTICIGHDRSLNNRPLQEDRAPASRSGAQFQGLRQGEGAWRVSRSSRVRKLRPLR